MIVYEYNQERKTIRIGTKVDGKKIVEFLCECKHPKSSHANKEIYGEQVRRGDQLITPIILEVNNGKCTEKKCRCYGYKIGAVLLENGKILKDSEFFRCEKCRKYLNKKKRTEAIYWFQRICKSCAPVYYKERIDELNVDILAVEELKVLLVKKYPNQIEKEADFEFEYGYDYECSGTKSVDISILMVVDKLLAKLKKEKETWESYK